MYYLYIKVEGNYFFWPEKKQQGKNNNSKLKVNGKKEKGSFCCDRNFRRTVC